MNTSLKVFGLLTILAVVPNVFCDDDDEPEDKPSDVIVLTETNFEEKLAEHKSGMLVEFYAPWCGHCKALAPEYDAAAAALKSTNSPIALGKVDATEHQDLAKRFEVQGYPTLRWFPDGDASNHMEYDGGRTSDTILEWIKKSTGPSVEDTDKFTAIPRKMEDIADKISSFPAFILVGASKESQEYAHFTTVAKGMRKSGDFFFASGMESSPLSLVVVHSGEAPTVVEGDDVKGHFGSSDDLKSLILSKEFPLFGELNGETFQKYVDRTGSPGLVWVLVNVAEGEKIDEVIEPYRLNVTRVAEKYVGKYSFTFTDTHTFKDAIKNMLGVEEFPAVVVNKKPQDKMKFILNLTAEAGPIEIEKLSKFIADIEEGKIEPILKSEDEPTDNDEALVKVVVGSTMEKEIFTESQDVLFEVYAPWCGHCKKLEPEYEKVAKKIVKEKVDHLVVLKKMDGTANDSPMDDIDWSGFPSLFYIEAGTRVAKQYDGPRTAKGIWKWIKDNHSKKDEISKILDANKAEKESSEDKAEDVVKEEL